MPGIRHDALCTGVQVKQGLYSGSCRVFLGFDMNIWRVHVVGFYRGGINLGFGSCLGLRA